MQDDTNIVQDDEPLVLLDPHQASSTPNRPFQKGELYYTLQLLVLKLYCHHR